MEATETEVMQPEASDLQVRIDSGAIANALTGIKGARDKNLYTAWYLAPLLSQYEQLSIYSDWLGRRVVDLPALEMTRAGITLTLKDATEKSAELVGQVESLLDEMNVFDALAEALINARLTGGSLLLMDIDDGREPNQPVNERAIKRIRGFYVVDRYRCWAQQSGDRLLWDLRNPEIYGVGSTAAAEKMGGFFSIHRDRVLRFEGDFLPWELRQENNGWGASCLDQLNDVYKKFLTGLEGVSQLLHDFDLFIHKIPNLGQMIRGGREAEIRNRAQANAVARSLYGGFLLDANGEDASFISRSAAGVADTLDRLLSLVKAATGIPHTLLMGESPSGMGASGRSEERDWAKTCHQKQERELRRPLRKFLRYLLLSKQGPTGGKEPEGWNFKFNDLYVPYPEEVAELRSKIAATDNTYKAMAVLREDEIRASRFGGPEWSMETTLIDSKEPEVIDATQQTNVIQLARAINSGEIPRDTGTQVLTLLLGIGEAEAKKIIASAGEAAEQQAAELAAADDEGPEPPGEPLTDPDTLAGGADPLAADPLAAEAPTDPLTATLDSKAGAIERRDGMTIAVTHSIAGVKKGYLITPYGQRFDSAYQSVAIASANGPHAYRAQWGTSGRSMLVLGCKTAATAKATIKRLGGDPKRYRVERLRSDELKALASHA